MPLVPCLLDHIHVGGPATAQGGTLVSSPSFRVIPVRYQMREWTRLQMNSALKYQVTPAFECSLLLPKLSPLFPILIADPQIFEHKKTLVILNNQNFNNELCSFSNWNNDNSYVRIFAYFQSCLSWGIRNQTLVIESNSQKWGWTTEFCFISWGRQETFCVSVSCINQSSMHDCYVKVWTNWFGNNPSKIFYNN